MDTRHHSSNCAEPLTISRRSIATAPSSYLWFVPIRLSAVSTACV
jgi:hypothetical protein